MMNKLLMAAIVVLVIAVSGCRKAQVGQQEYNNTRLTVNMTDAPANYDAINLDIIGIKANINQETGMLGNEQGWVTLHVNAGMYNLLDFTNGATAKLVDQFFAPAYISQLRLMLADDNTIVVDGVTYPLNIPSGGASNLTIPVDQVMNYGDSNSVVFDFDAAQSIRENSPTSYSLIGVFHLVDQTKGSVHGSITPVTAGVFVQITSTTNPDFVYTTYTDASGQFLLQGAHIGTYTLVVTPSASSGLNMATLNGVMVTGGSTTETGAIAL